jgi:putative Holliday junction resolvase
MKIVMDNNSLSGNILGLDYGTARIGVARINSIAKIAQPLDPIKITNSEPISAISKLISEYQAECIVIGLPRGLEGQETAQTSTTRDFAIKLKQNIDIPVYMIDEAGTSKLAEEKISSYSSNSIDSVAATIILEDFINIKNISELEVKV